MAYEPYVTSDYYKNEYGGTIGAGGAACKSSPAGQSSH